MLTTMVNAANQLGECVLWCDRSARVLWTDILGAVLYAHDPASGVTASWPMPERLCSFALSADDDVLLLGLASQLAFFRLSSATVSPIAAVEPDLATRLNDGRCDRQGNFVFGTFHEEEPRRAVGAFYRLNARDLSLELLALGNVAIANSICFSPDGATMYYCDSPQRAIRRCDYPALTGDRVFAETPATGEPDGACIDADGYLWSAHWGSSQVLRYAPDGSIERALESPARQSSCVAIGGAALDLLLCSSATVGLAEPGASDGALLSSPLPGIRGLPESRFAGSPHQLARASQAQ
jgi:L-arabinonolactonase